MLQDYHSDILNLEDGSSFRDLSKPMGAIQVFRENEARQRYQTLCYDAAQQPDVGISSPCHFGVHYSTPGALLHYFVRLQPFTAMALAFQSKIFIFDYIYNA